MLINCSDFLTRSYDIGGVVSVMALSSLYILMTQHGLEYPNFYEKLYALLEPAIFMAKYRAKFFEVLLYVSGFSFVWQVSLYELGLEGLVNNCLCFYEYVSYDGEMDVRW